MLSNKRIQYATYLELLKRGDHFGLSRWGDGEWIATLGPGRSQHANADGTKYTEGLKSALRHTLRHPHHHPFFYGILNIAITHLEPRIDNWLARIGSEIVWVDGDVLLNVSLRGELYPFVKQVRQHRYAVYVGPEKLKKTISRFFPGASYITVPDSTAFDDWRAVADDILKTRRTIALFSAGMASNVIMHHVWRCTAGGITLVDCGSMFDGYANASSRSYIKQYDWGRLFAVNSGAKRLEPGETFRNGK